MSNRPPTSGLYRSQLARRSGCNIETIRYYEKAGLLPEPPRSTGGYRLYDERHVARLRFILRGRALGFSLSELRDLIELTDTGALTCAEVKQRTERHLAEVREKIADLSRIERVLSETAAQCSGDAVPQCPVLEALSA